MLHKRKRRIRRIVLLLLLILLLTSGAVLLRYQRGYREAAGAYAELSSAYRQGQESLPDAPGEGGTLPEELLEGLPGEEDAGLGRPPWETFAAELEIDFSRLYELNPDVRGWLYCPGTVLDYPVLQGETNDTYLHTMPSGARNVAGSIFIDCRCGTDPMDAYTLIYGHKMRDGSMFGTLHDWSSQDFYEAHPVLYYITAEEKYCLYIVAGYVTDVNDAIYQIPKSKEAFAAILSLGREKSDFHTDAVSAWIPKDADVQQLLLLSTCSYEFQNARFVLITIPAKIG